MAAYHNSSAPCFAPEGLVEMANGCSKLVKDLVRGDEVKTASGTASIVCVVQTHSDSGTMSLVTLPGGLRLTPWHPVLMGDSWVFPSSVRNAWSQDCDSVYSFVLDDGHTMIINGVTTVTLGHGKTGDVREHSFFGTSQVVDCLRQLRGWNQGLVQLRTGCVVRDPATGLVCDLMQLHRASPTATQALKFDFTLHEPRPATRSNPDESVSGSQEA